MASESIFRAGKGLGIDGGPEIIEGSVDPSAVSTPATIGSLYLRSNGTVYRKSGAGDTDWTLLGDDAGSSEDGYQNTFMGKTGLGSETPSYTDENNISDGDSLETAIDKLDDAAGDRQYTEDNYVTDSEDLTSSIDASLMSEDASMKLSR